MRLKVEKGIKGGFMNSWAVWLGAMAADALVHVCCVFRGFPFFRVCGRNRFLMAVLVVLSLFIQVLRAL
jgi:hypothetical protein